MTSSRFAKRWHLLPLLSLVAMVPEVVMAAGPVTVTVDEGTNINAAAAPDGSVILDLQGLMFRVPRGGGQAVQLSTVDMEAARPHVGPDGRIAFQSYAGGGYHIWSMAADGSDVRQVTSGPFDDREPRWSPDGRHIAFSSDRGGSYDIWSVEIDTGKVRQWTNGAGQEGEPSWSADGRSIAFASERGIEQVEADGATRLLFAGAKDVSLRAPAWSPDGRRLAYLRQSATRIDLMLSGTALVEDEDIFPFTPNWLDAGTLLYTADGKIRRRPVSGARGDVPFSASLSLPKLDYTKKTYDFDDRTPHQVKGILTPALSPDARQVAFVALGDLWVMPVGGKPKRLTRDAYYEVHPAWSPDGRQLAYASDREGYENIYIRDMASGRERRVTSMTGGVAAPAWSPDGQSLAFQDKDGGTHILDIASGETRKLSPTFFVPGRPSWSADGKTIAMTFSKAYSARYREGINQIALIDVESGAVRERSPAEPHSSIATRGDDGPIFSPDGQSMLFILSSNLWISPVDPTGQANGPARRINDAVSDAPSWSGDSRHILYLSNGALKLLDVTSGSEKTLPVDLHYRRAIPAQASIIRGGALWDGIARAVRRDVDILVVGNRVSAIGAAGSLKHRGARIVDATGLTVMPGLWDNHVHHEFFAPFTGDRLGRLNLAYGVTSIVGMGDAVYRAIEDRESLISGARVGPNFYATGEALDGKRTFYHVMRPVADETELARELSRAKALDYDIMKTYVRMPAPLMRDAAAAARDMGIPTTSHYLSPGLLVGEDATSHLSATQRLGYSRVQSSEGETYNDVISLYGAGQRSVTTTFQVTKFLMHDEVKDDPRLILYPRADLEGLTRGNVARPADPACTTLPCRQVRAFRRIADAGGRVVVGTDYFNPGIGVHGNLRMLVTYGWTPYDALRSATIESARYMGVDKDVGTVEPGKVADLVLVDGNPLDDIYDASKVRKVLRGGMVYGLDDILRPFGR